MGQVAQSFQRQFDRMWETLREAIRNYPDDEWKKAGRQVFFVPSRLAYHIIAAAEYYAGTDPSNRKRGLELGVPWSTEELEKLPDRPAIQNYLEAIRQKMNARLEELADADFLSPNPFKGRGENLLELMIYTLRHCQHHLGQLNGELKCRGLPPASWR